MPVKSDKRAGSRLHDPAILVYGIRGNQGTVHIYPQASLAIEGRRIDTEPPEDRNGIQTRRETGGGNQQGREGDNLGKPEEEV